MAKNYKKVYGQEGEKQVCTYLEKKGYIIRAVNYLIKNGEIDIIVQKGNIYAFVEVKTRKHSPSFPLSLLIPFSKQQKVIHTALHYLAYNNLSLADYIIRFDVAFVCEENIEYIENAYTFSSD